MTTHFAAARPLVHSVEVTKDRQFHMRVGAEDEARLAELSKHYEMTAAQVVRMLIKREAEAVAGAAAAAGAERALRPAGKEPTRPRETPRRR